MIFLGSTNFRKIAGEFLSGFDGEFFPQNVRPCFSRISPPPPQKKTFTPKFTSRIVGIPLQFHFLKPKIYSRRFSAFWGDQKCIPCWYYSLKIDSPRGNVIGALKGGCFDQGLFSNVSSRVFHGFRGSSKCWS